MKDEKLENMKRELQDELVKRDLLLQDSTNNIRELYYINKEIELLRNLINKREKDPNFSIR